MLLLDEPLSGVDAASAARIEAVFGELRGRGPDPARRHARRRAGAPLGPRRLPARRADRVRRRRREVLTTDVLRRTYGAELVVLEGGRARGGGRATTSTDARLAARPVPGAHAARARRGADPRRRLRPARRLGAALPPELRRRVALARDAARARGRRRWPARRCCSARPAACSWPPRRSRWPGATSGSAATSAWRWRSASLFGLGRAARALARRARAARRAAVRRPARRHRAATSSRRRCSPAPSRVALALAPPAAGAERVRPRGRAVARRAARRAGSWSLLVLLAVCTVAAVRGLGNLLVVALILAPGRGRAQPRAAAAGRARPGRRAGRAGRRARAARLLPPGRRGGRVGRARGRRCSSPSSLDRLDTNA